MVTPANTAKQPRIAGWLASWHAGCLVFGPGLHSGGHLLNHQFEPEYLESLAGQELVQSNFNHILLLDFLSVSVFPQAPL